MNAGQRVRVVVPQSTSKTPYGIGHEFEIVGVFFQGARITCPDGWAWSPEWLEEVNDES